jgi:uncharacterized membrane protein YphA (DoxX/SURF4 family)
VRFRAWHVPLRLVTGAFILNAGVSKLQSSDEESAKHLHDLAADAYPVFEGLEPTLFTRLVGCGEVGLGTALLAPVVPPGLAGTGLGIFSGALLGVYLRTPHMTREDGMRPSPSGIAFAKDVWMAGIAAALMLDGAAQAVRRALPERHTKTAPPRTGFRRRGAGAALPPAPAPLRRNRLARPTRPRG